MTNQKTIIDKINQAIIYLSNRQSHHSYGAVSSAFTRNYFSMDHDYRTEFSKWYQDTSFYDVDTMPQRILSKEAYFIVPQTYEKSMRFDFAHIALDSTWGYGKYFDGESTEPTPEAEQSLEDLTKLFSTYFNTEITFIADVDCDYEDDLNLIVRVVLPKSKEEKKPEVKKSLNKEEKLNDKAKKANDKVKKYQQELIDFNIKIQNKIQEQSSKLKTCSHCDSKVNIKHIKTHKCPVCSAPMYSNTDLKRFNNLTIKINKSKEEVKNVNVEINKYLTA